MNKDNKKMAQERRAQERARAEKAAKWKAMLPMLLGVLFVAVAGIAYFGSGSFRKTIPLQTEEAAQTDQAEEAASEAADTSGQTAATEGDGSYVTFDASALKGCYDISGDKLTYVQIKVKDYGTITAALDETIAPESVKNFVALARDGFYDGLTFHRIIDGFMIQGGDPLGNGMGGSEKTIKGEFNDNGVENPITHVRGAISMARSQLPDSASSQFFIVQSDSTFLDGQYAGFGYVTDGLDVVDQISKDAKPTDNNGSIAKENQPVIESVTVIS